MITCYDSNGKIIKTLYQWDTNRIITLRGEDFTDVIEVHLSHEICGTATTVLPLNDGTALLNNNTLSFIIPDALLQIAKPLIVYLYRNTPSDEDMTSGEVRIPIRPRARPTDYEDKEAEREAAELQREQNELLRIANENARRAAEQGRRDAELERQANELIRIANEQERIARGTLFIADYDITTYEEVEAARARGKMVICRSAQYGDALLMDITAEKVLFENHEVIITLFKDGDPAWVAEHQPLFALENEPTEGHYDIGLSSGGAYDALHTPPTDETAGMVKTNSAAGITTNDDGQLVVNGTLVRTPQNGWYFPHPTKEPPAFVGSGGIVMAYEAPGMEYPQNSLVNNFIPGITFGYGFSNLLKNTNTFTVPAHQGSTMAVITHIAGMLSGGYVSASVREGDVTYIRSAKVTSVKYADGTDVTPVFTDEQANQEVVVTLEKPLSETVNITGYRLRVWPNPGWGSINWGEGNGTSAGMRWNNIQIGLNLYSVNGWSLQQGTNHAIGSGVSIGSNLYGNPNKPNYMFGSYHMGSGSDKGDLFLIGHSSKSNPNTVFAIGNGELASDRKTPIRSNIFEIQEEGKQTVVMMKSPNGTEFDLKVDDSGNLTVTPRS